MRVVERPLPAILWCEESAEAESGIPGTLFARASVIGATSEPANEC